MLYLISSTMYKFLGFGLLVAVISFGGLKLVRPEVDSVADSFGSNRELLAEVSLVKPPTEEEAPIPASAVHPVSVSKSSIAKSEAPSVPARSVKTEEETPVLPPPAVAPPAPVFPGSDLLSPDEIAKRSGSETAAPEAKPAEGANPAPINAPSSNSSQTGKVLISEIRLTGGSGKAYEDFIELYNSGSTAVDLSGWNLRKRTVSGSDSSVRVFPEGSIVPARGFFLWASSEKEYASSVGADIASAATLANNNSIALFNAEDALVDAVHWGEGHVNGYGEGAAIVAVLNAGESYERRAFSGACSDPSGSETLGNGCDTDSNSLDFVVRTVSQPQNSKSAAE